MRPGAKLRLMKPRIRQRLGLFMKTKRGSRTFEAFGKRIGRSGSTVHRIENCNQNITGDLLEGLATTFNCDITDLFPPLPENPE